VFWFWVQLDEHAGWWSISPQHIAKDEPHPDQQRDLLSSKVLIERLLAFGLRGHCYGGNCPPRLCFRVCGCTEDAWEECGVLLPTPPCSVAQHMFVRLLQDESLLTCCQWYMLGPWQTNPILVVALVPYQYFLVCLSVEFIAFSACFFRNMHIHCASSRSKVTEVDWICHFVLIEQLIWQLHADLIVFECFV